MSGPRIEIEYCRRCRFQPRAAWLAQEILASLEEDVGEIALVPSSGGILEVRVDGQVVATNRDGGDLPDAREVKRAIRDLVAPDRKIGHE
jgi:selenoprotein W-related protein